MAKRFKDALALGSKLQGYRIERVLGQGAFGITYLAKNMRLDHLVAIKEYLPADLAGRQNTTVEPRSELHEDAFLWGISRFLQEAKTLVKFKHPNIVRVYDFFETNNTAYMLMDYEEGESLHEVFKRRGTLSEQAILNILFPLLDGLEVLHQGNIIHRDIKPANIYIRKDGSPVLLDFGSARTALNNHTNTMTSMLTPGYAPFEQYYQDAKQQGPWSDIYALGAVIYQAIMGKKPMESSLRGAAKMAGDPDPLIPAMSLQGGRYSNELLQSVDQALIVIAKERPQQIATWRLALPQIQAKPTENAVEILASQQENEAVANLVEQLVLDGDVSSFEQTDPNLGLNIDEINEDEEGHTSPRHYQINSSITTHTSIKADKPDQPDNLNAIQEGEESDKAGKLDVLPVATNYDQPLLEKTIAMELLYIPQGRFLMGSPKSDPERNSEERQHPVSVKGFWMAKYAITQRQWWKIMLRNPAQFHEDELCPIENVSWNEVLDFIKELNRRSGNTYRLPTEAEWEYAARGGTTTPYYTGESINTDQANYNGNTGCVNCPITWNFRQKTVAVGSFEPNPFGLYEMLGNVWEWTASTYHEDYNGQELKVAHSKDRGKRVKRGGSWMDNPSWLRAADRGRNNPDFKNSGLGFRLVRDD